MAVSSDPDHRAQAIVIWSSKDSGRRGSYVDYYILASGKDDSAIVRSAAVRALGLCGDRKAVPALIDATRDPSPAVRWDAAVSLDALPDDSAIDALRQMAYQEKDVNARVAAIRAMRHYARIEVVDTLLKCLGDQPFAVSRQARASLDEIVGMDFGYDVDAWEKYLSKGLPPKPAPKRAWWQ